MTTRSEIADWLKRGKGRGATHAIIVCDTFGYEDYPVYVMPDQVVHEEMKKYDGQNMQKIMEVYNLSMDLDEQVNSQTRVFNL